MRRSPPDLIYTLLDKESRARVPTCAVVYPTPMMKIDQSRYPLLYKLAQGADWLGTDEFHTLVGIGGGGLWETWLGFVAVNGGLGHYASRLKGPKDQCAIAFNEIAVAHFLVTECRLLILGWQVPGAHSMLGEFLVGFDA